MDKKRQVTDYLYPFYAFFLVGVGHYFLYFFSSMVLVQQSWENTIIPLIQAGVFFIAANFYSWYFVSIVFTPILVFLLKRVKREKFSLKLAIINSIVAIPVIFVLILTWALFHLAIGTQLAI